MSVRLLAGLIVLLVASARPAAAAVVLRAADITEESESSSQGPILSDPMPPPEVRHSVYGPNAFPNDARNFAGVGPDGLTVLTNLIASMRFVTGNFIVHEYTDQRFRVVFELDAPASFNFTMKPGNIDYDLTLLPTLQAEGQPAVTLVDPRTQTDYFTWNTSGTLPAGVYIYSGNLNESQRLGGGNDRYRSEVVSYLDMKLTVAPEPAALALLGAGALLPLSRRFRRR